jgi:hypothetical protein
MLSMRVTSRTRKASTESIDPSEDVLLAVGPVGLSKCVASLPGGAFITCVILSLLYNFDESTATHCNVRIIF